MMLVKIPEVKKKYLKKNRNSNGSGNFKIGLGYRNPVCRQMVYLYLFIQHMKILLFVTSVMS